MMRMAAILGMGVALAGCTFSVKGMPDDTTSTRSVERAERARDSASRTHPACRDSRVDRRDQNDGCAEVVRRGQ